MSNQTPCPDNGKCGYPRHYTNSAQYQKCLETTRSRTVTKEEISGSGVTLVPGYGSLTPIGSAGATEVDSGRLVDFITDNDLSFGDISVDERWHDWITVEAPGHTAITIDLSGCETMEDVRAATIEALREYDPSGSSSIAGPDNDHFKKIADRLERQENIEGADARAKERRTQDIAKGLSADSDLDLYAIDRGGFSIDDPDLQNLHGGYIPHLNGALIEFDDGKKARIRVIERHGQEESRLFTLEGEEIPFLEHSDKSYRVAEFDGDPRRQHEEMEYQFYREKERKAQERSARSMADLRDVALSGVSSEMNLDNSRLWNISLTSGVFGRDVKDSVRVIGSGDDGSKPFRIEISEDGDVKEGFGSAKGNTSADKSEIEKTIIRNLLNDNGRAVKDAFRDKRDVRYATQERVIAQQDIEEQFGKRI